MVVLGQLEDERQASSTGALFLEIAIAADCHFGWHGLTHPKRHHSTWS
jgi:hypothetical protein